MPRTRPTTVGSSELPPVATLAELAVFERVDIRTIRRAVDAGEIPGAYKRGRSWRVRTDIYLAALGHSTKDDGVA